MYRSLIDTFFGIHQYSWTTVRSLNTPQDGYLIPVTPKDLYGFNKELPTLELHGVLKKSFLDIFESEMSVYWKFQDGEQLNFLKNKQWSTRVPNKDALQNIYSDKQRTH
nr:uncharacterized protein LOC105317483 [Crassostrea gigas]